MPKQATPGTFFTGSLCLAKLENELLRKAVQFDVQYHVVDNGRQKTEKEALSTVIVAKSKNSTTGFAEAGYRGMASCMAKSK